MRIFRHSHSKSQLKSFTLIDVQLILFRYSLFDVLISQVENKEGIEDKMELFL